MILTQGDDYWMLGNKDVKGVEMPEKGFEVHF